MAIMKSKGYTLIEILVVMSIVVIISVFSLNFLSSILKGSNKTSLTSEIKQNGNYVLDVISFYIRNAVSIDCSTPNTITLHEWDNSTVIFSLLARDDTNKINARIASNSAALTNANQTNGVSVTNLTFSCTSSQPPVVTVNFTISQSHWAPDNPESKSTIPFSTSVSLRTY